MMSAYPIRRKGKRTGWFILLALPLCVLLACAVLGCKGEPTTRRQVTKKVVPKEPSAPAPQKAAVAPTETKAGEPALEEGASLPPEAAAEEEQPAVGYPPKAERDPFKSFVATRAPVEAPSEKSPRIKTPLQRYSLDQLKVVGIITGGNVREALLEDDVGKGYVVVVGDEVGSEGGKITAIQPDRIVIESTYRDVLGNKKVRRIVKKLYTSEEGENP
jgi:Tfp pilus assembly protein PilP